MDKHPKPGQPDQSGRSPEIPAGQQPPEKQLIPEKGEEYLREIANIEDTPSPEEDEEAIRIERKNTGSQILKD
jgi:hypothetical protein